MAAGTRIRRSAQQQRSNLWSSKASLADGDFRQIAARLNKHLISQSLGL